MTTLRSLLPTYSDYTTPDLTNRTQMMNRLKTGQELVFAGACYPFESSYCRNIMCCWVVPAGVTRLTFEIWGSGGSGAGSCCCSIGIPGGAGAYARKQVKATVPGGLAGCVYTLVPAYATCCSPTQGCGFRGCTSYVTGYGLTNFCAEGGIPGLGMCAPNWSNGSGNTFCTYFTNNCNKGWAWNCGTYAAWCSCYFGADYGIPGCTGALYTDCCNPNFCQFKTIRPLPGNLPATAMTGGGQSYITNRFCNSDCSAGSWDGCRSGFGIIGGSGVGTPGAGGLGAATCNGNTCVCGGPGGSGMVRITYSYDTYVQ